MTNKNKIIASKISLYRTYNGDMQNTILQDYSNKNGYIECVYFGEEEKGYKVYVLNNKAFEDNFFFYEVILKDSDFLLEYYESNEDCILDDVLNYFGERYDEM